MALLGTGIWAYHSLVASGGGGGMPAPAGYTAQQMIFDDQFSGTSLDTTKWNTYLGAQGTVWNNHGRLATPYSGPNTFTNEAAMFAPSQVSVNDGLTLTAQRNTNAYAGTYPWLSGAVTTEGKFSLPTTGWYVQAKIKVPDMTQGMWPSMWFLPGQSGTPFNEIDFVQGGFTEGGGPVNQSPLGTGYFPTGQSNPVDEAVPNLGFDATAGYHTYGIQWKPGVGINGFVDGNLVWTVTQAQVPGGIVAQPYEMILNLQVATVSDSVWHTVPTATSPGGSMDVAEIQAYSNS